jgi:hypothetical protein
LKLDNDTLLRQTIIELLRARKPDGSICPSEATRALFDDWRPYMPQVRHVALVMAQTETIVITQNGRPIDLDAFERGEIPGPIRLRLGKQ